MISSRLSPAVVPLPLFCEFLYRPASLPPSNWFLRALPSKGRMRRTVATRDVQPVYLHGEFLEWDARYCRGFVDQYWRADAVQFISPKDLEFGSFWGTLSDAALDLCTICRFDQDSLNIVMHIFGRIMTVLSYRHFAVRWSLLCIFYVVWYLPLLWQISSNFILIGN